MRLYNPVSMRLSGSNMKIRSDRFNTYFLLAAVLAIVVGCQTAEQKEKNEKKQLSTLRIHLEVSPDGTEAKDPVPVYRESPVLLHISKDPFLTEADVAGAKVLDVMGGFAIQVQVDRRGIFLLEQYTTANKGRRMVIFSQFGITKAEARWLAAPLIKQRIADGFLVFTPDATREESERIVRGLNNVAAKNKKRNL